MIDYAALKIITNDCEEALDKDISHENLCMFCNAMQRQAVNPTLSAF